METVGAYEAKTHLPQLLKRVSKGEKIMITKHGVAVATLQPPDPAKKGSVGETISELRKFRRRQRLDGCSLRKLITEGRR